jgi:hypothetical protein
VVCSFLNFELEEEGNTALLHHLPKLFAESTVSGSAAGLGCGLVVAPVQATADKTALY